MEDVVPLVSVVRVTMEVVEVYGEILDVYIVVQEVSVRLLISEIMGIVMVVLDLEVDAYLCVVRCDV